MKKSPLDIMNMFGKIASDKAKSPGKVKAAPKAKAPASDMDEDDDLAPAPKASKPNPFKKAIK